MAQKPGPFNTKVKEIILLSHCFLACQFSNGYDETEVGMDKIQWIDMQLSSARCSFHDVDLGTSNPGPTRQTGPVHHHPSSGVVHLSIRHHAGECEVAAGGPIMPGS